MNYTCGITEDDFLDMLMQRLNYWTDDKKTHEMFEKMYKDMIDGGCFIDNTESIMSIVDNDYVNNTSVIDTSEDDWNKIVEFYKQNGLDDCSSENFECGAWRIESVDDEDNPTQMLVRL